VGVNEVAEPEDALPGLPNWEIEELKSITDGHILLKPPTDSSEWSWNLDPYKSVARIGMDALNVTPVSRANSQQRAGRAGRTGCDGGATRGCTPSEFFFTRNTARYLQLAAAASPRPRPLDGWPYLCKNRLEPTLTQNSARDFFRACPLYLFTLVPFLVLLNLTTLDGAGPRASAVGLEGRPVVRVGAVVRGAWWSISSDIIQDAQQAGWNIRLAGLALARGPEAGLGRGTGPIHLCVSRNSLSLI